MENQPNKLLSDQVLTLWQSKQYHFRSGLMPSFEYKILIRNAEI